MVASVLKIVQVGNPVLRQRARALTRDEILAPSMSLLVEKMRDTMRDAPGVGLAAPQIGESLQLVVVEDRPELLEMLDPRERALRERTPLPFQALFNPRLAVVDPTPVTFFEGCLSFADFVMLVPRARAVRVEALDHQANPVILELRGWPARILQHEVDHLRGVVCVDRMHSRSLCRASEHARHWQGQSAEAVLATLAEGALETDPDLAHEANDNEANDALPLDKPPA